LHYPDAEYIKVVQDNLNAHSASSLYEAPLPEEAFELTKRFEFHFTPRRAKCDKVVFISPASTLALY
jgi:hypothetical protein